MFNRCEVCTWPGCISTEKSSTGDRILGARGSKKTEDSSTGEKFVARNLKGDLQVKILYMAGEK